MIDRASVGPGAGKLARRLLPPLLAILAIGLVGLWLTRNGPGRFEVSAVLWFRLDQDHGVIAGPVWMHDVWLALTWLGDTGPRIAVALLTVLALIVAGRWPSGLFAAAVLASGIGLSSLLKHWIDRPRPQLVVHLDQVHSASFPSGHALNSTLFYGLLALLLCGLLRSRGARRLLLALALLLAFATGISRIALGVHYPSDVIAGWLIAASWLWFCWALAGGQKSDVLSPRRQERQGKQRKAEDECRRNRRAGR